MAGLLAIIRPQRRKGKKQEGPLATKPEQSSAEF
jgi:hypothetical protein